MTDYSKLPAANQETIRAEIDGSSYFILQAIPVLTSILENRYKKNTFNFIQIEGNDDPVLKKLDRECGLDYLLELGKKETENKEVFGVAGRTIYYRKDKHRFENFTIRLERESGLPTEYDKLKASISKGGLCPRYMLTTFVDTEINSFVSFGYARIIDIIDFIDKGLARKCKTNEALKGQSYFWAVDWKPFIDAGYETIIYRGENWHA